MIQSFHSQSVHVPKIFVKVAKSYSHKKKILGQNLKTNSHTPGIKTSHIMKLNWCIVYKQVYEKKGLKHVGTVIDQFRDLLCSKILYK